MAPRCGALLLAVCAASAACSSNSGSAGPAREAVSSGPVVGPRTITGRVPVEPGAFPAIVIFEPDTPDTSPQATVPFMDQVQQTFIPQILFVRTGQVVEFHNNDEVPHNVRVQDDAKKAPAFNVSIPIGEKFRFVFPHDGFYSVGCDIHPSMSSQIIATTSGLAAAADPQGQFAIGNVTEGRYTATVYAGETTITKPIVVGTSSAPLDLTHQ